MSNTFNIQSSEDDTASYLAGAVAFERYVDALAGTLHYVKAKRRSKHDVYLSWDEWRIWYKGDPMQGNWTEAPHLAEEIYNLEDALVVAQWRGIKPITLYPCSTSRVAATELSTPPLIATTTVLVLKLFLLGPESCIRI